MRLNDILAELLLYEGQTVYNDIHKWTKDAKDKGCKIEFHKPKSSEIMAFAMKPEGARAEVELGVYYQGDDLNKGVLFVNHREFMVWNKTGDMKKQLKDIK